MFNPSEQFALNTITRASIAHKFNYAIAVGNLKVDEFTDTDQRLTNELCVDLAYEFGQIDDDGREENRVAQETEIINAIIIARFGATTQPTEFKDSSEATEFMETLLWMLSDPKLLHWIQQTDYNFGTNLMPIITQIRDNYDSFFDQICEID